MPKLTNFGEFSNLEVCDQTVLPDRSTLKGQKIDGKCQHWKIKMSHFGLFFSNFRFFWVIFNNFFGLELGSISKDEKWKWFFRQRVWYSSQFPVFASKLFCILWEEGELKEVLGIFQRLAKQNPLPGNMKNDPIHSYMGT